MICGISGVLTKNGQEKLRGGFCGGLVHGGFCSEHDVILQMRGGVFS